MSQVRVDAVDGKHPAAQVRHGHDLPLQALGRVHGEDLHPVLRDGHLGGRQTVLDHRGGVEKASRPDTVAPGRAAA